MEKNYRKKNTRLPAVDTVNLRHVTNIKLMLIQVPFVKKFLHYL